MRTYIDTYRQTNRQTYKTYITYINTYIYYIHACIYYIHTDIHTYIHTYIHAETDTKMDCYIERKEDQTWSSAPALEPF